MLWMAGVCQTFSKSKSSSCLLTVSRYGHFCTLLRFAGGAAGVCAGSLRFIVCGVECVAGRAISFGDTTQTGHKKMFSDPDVVVESDSDGGSPSLDDGGLAAQPKAKKQRVAPAVQASSVSHMTRTHALPAYLLTPIHSRTLPLRMRSLMDALACVPHAPHHFLSDAKWNWVIVGTPQQAARSLTQFPLSRVKKIIRMDRDIKFVNQDAVVAISKATVSRLFFGSLLSLSSFLFHPFSFIHCFAFFFLYLHVVLFLHFFFFPSFFCFHSFLSFRFFCCLFCHFFFLFFSSFIHEYVLVSFNALICCL